MTTKWINIKDRMPEANVPVLLHTASDYGKAILRACWIPRFYLIDHEQEGDAEYNEKTDEYYWPEGWYEWNQQEETHWRITDEVTHWMKMPEPPEIK